jgi:hypothetical protein
MIYKKTCKRINKLKKKVSQRAGFWGKVTLESLIGNKEDVKRLYEIIGYLPAGMFIYKDKKIIYRAFKDNGSDATLVIDKSQKYDESKLIYQLYVNTDPIQFDFYNEKITPEMTDTSYFYHEAKNKCITFSLKELKKGYQYQGTTNSKISYDIPQEFTNLQHQYNLQGHNSDPHLYDDPNHGNQSNYNETNAIYNDPDEVLSVLPQRPSRTVALSASSIPQLIESQNPYEDMSSPPPLPTRRGQQSSSSKVKPQRLQQPLPQDNDNDNAPPLPVKKSKSGQYVSPRRG